MRSIFGSLILALLLSPSAALAAGEPGPAVAETPQDPVLARVADATSRQDWARAAEILREAVARSPDQADYHNLYAYAIRKGANPDMNIVFKHYHEALRLDPKHRGAHEYIGEAYLTVGNLAKAKEHLAELDRLCFFGCPEFNDLKRAVADYEKRIAKQ